MARKMHRLTHTIDRPMLHSGVKRKASQFGDSSGGYIGGTAAPGGVPQPMPISSFIDLNNRVSVRGFTTGLFHGDPISPNMQPDISFDMANAAATAYGISGGIPLSAMPQKLSVFGGNRFHEFGGVEAPLIRKGNPVVSSGRTIMLNHAECVHKCKKWDKEGEKLERCLDECYVRYGPHLYTTLPHPR